jgi:predicted amidophosphoribosyltransferase
MAIAVPAGPVPGVLPEPIRLVPPPEPPRHVSRNRHLPRLCRSCSAPLASQEDDCWRCGADSSRFPK